MRQFIGDVRAAVPNHPPLYVHLSNFFGHATMTAIAALTAGATAADVCLNSTGHHCGHTSLGEVALGLRGLYGVDCGIRTEKIAEAARIVEKHTSVPRRLDGAIVGEYAFMGDGAYWAAEAHLPFEERMHATFPLAPEVVGAQEKVVWSDRTASFDAVSIRVTQAGHGTPTHEQCAQIVAQIRTVVDRRGVYPGWLEDAEVAELIDSVMNGS
jgi:isopropylmalate/homocitrate/citramalate synthase